MITESNYLKIEELPDGSLKLTLTEDGREFLEESQANGWKNVWWELLEQTSCNGSYAATDANEVGGLTDSPMILNYKDTEDDGSVLLHDDNKLWWYPEYQVIDEFKELLTEGFIIFTLAE